MPVPGPCVVLREGLLVRSNWYISARVVCLAVAWLLFVVSFVVPAVREVRLIDDPGRDVSFRARTADNLDMDQLTAGAREDARPAAPDVSGDAALAEAPGVADAAGADPGAMLGFRAFTATALSLMNPAGWVPLIRNPANLLLFVVALASLPMLVAPMLDRWTAGGLHWVLGSVYLTAALVLLGVVWPNLIAGATLGFFLWTAGFALMGVGTFLPEAWSYRLSFGEEEEEVRVGLRYSKSSVNRRRERDLAKWGQTASAKDQAKAKSGSSGRSRSRSSGQYYPTRKK